MTEYMKAWQFKAKCLKVMDRVKRTRRKIIITKRNIPVAQLVPIEEKEIAAFGKLKGTIHIRGNIIAPIEEEWGANH
jgi:prevent-host-death family protein